MDAFAVHESRKIVDAGIKAGAEVIVEPGDPPRDNEVGLPQLSLKHLNV